MEIVRIHVDMVNTLMELNVYLVTKVAMIVIRQEILIVLIVQLDIWILMVPAFQAAHKDRYI